MTCGCRPTQRVLTSGLNGERIDPTDLLSVRTCGRRLVENQRISVMDKRLDDPRRAAAQEGGGCSAPAPFASCLLRPCTVGAAHWHPSSHLNPFSFAAQGRRPPLWRRRRRHRRRAGRRVQKGAREGVLRRSEADDHHRAGPAARAVNAGSGAGSRAVFTPCSLLACAKWVFLTVGRLRVACRGCTRSGWWRWLAPGTSQASRPSGKSKSPFHHSSGALS